MRLDAKGSTRIRPVLARAPPALTFRDKEVDGSLFIGNGNVQDLQPPIPDLCRESRGPRLGELRVGLDREDSEPLSQVERVS